eukprot:6336906-Prymnesium_polylepis.1
MGARNGSSFPAAARCGFCAIVLLGGTSSARTGMAVPVVGPCWSGVCGLHGHRSVSVVLRVRFGCPSSL